MSCSGVEVVIELVDAKLLQSVIEGSSLDLVEKRAITRFETRVETVSRAPAVIREAVRRQFGVHVPVQRHPPGLQR